MEWFKSQRSRRRGGKLNERELTWLAKYDTPLSTMTVSERWSRSLQECVDFHTQHGRNPSLRGDGPDERRLFDWIVRQRHPFNVIPDDELVRRHAILDERLPSWRAADVDELWFRQLAELTQFIAENGRPPTRRSSPLESRLNRWVEAQRRASSGAAPRRKWDAQRAAALDQAVPNWRDWSATREELRWQENVDRLASFVTSEGRLPRPGSSREETLLYTWLLAQQHRHHRKAGSPMSAEEAGALDSAAPGWRDTREARWQEMLSALSSFASQHGRIPLRADDKRLSAWLHNQRRNAAGLDGRIPNQVRMDALDAAVPGWRIAGGQKGARNKIPA